jgi:integrase
VETRTKKAQREGTTNNTHIKETIINYAWQLKRNGYAESTIKSNSNLITVLIKRGADLNNPNSVKDVIAKQETWSKGRKNNAVKAYSIYAKQNNLTWEKPKYKPIEKPQFIPTEQELDSLIAAASKQMSTYLQVLKETGARRGEILHLTWDDIDFAQNAIRITPEKGSNPRIFKISIKLQTMLNILPKTNQQVFVYKNEFYLDKGFRRLRKKTAHKLGNPRLLKIHFHTIRHWKATIEYARTKDVLYVQKLLGHKDLKTTLRYIQFVEIPQEERFISKLANNAEEAVELVTLGFEYVTG